MNGERPASEAPDHDAILRKRVLVVPDVAALLDISDSAVRSMHRRGALPGWKPGDRLYFDRDIVLGLLRGDPPASPPAGRAEGGRNVRRLRPRGRRRGSQPSEGAQ